MSTIPTSLTENQFDQHIRPYISTAKRGYECQIPLYKVFNYILYRLHTGCQWHRLPIEPDADDPRQKEISHHAVYYHFRKWSRDGSLEKVWQGSVMTIKADLNLSELNLDGSHAIAKKGVVCQELCKSVGAGHWAVTVMLRNFKPRMTA